MRAIQGVLFSLSLGLLSVSAAANSSAPLCPGEARLAGMSPVHVVSKDPSEIDLLRCIVQGDREHAMTLIGAGEPSDVGAAYAAAAGHAGLVAKLLEAGADPNAEGPYGEIPALTLAARRGHADVVDVLLAAGADPDRAGDEEFSGGSALAAALLAGHVEIGARLLERGADVDRAESYHQWTALWQLVCRGAEATRREEGIELLLGHGADLEARDLGAMDGWRNSGRTPLACAVASGDAGLVERLLRAGADPNALVDGGIRILELADEGRPRKVAARLASRGAVVDRPLPSSEEVYRALERSGLEDAKTFYLLGADRIEPARRGPRFASLYRDRELAPYMAKDLDGDGQPELAVVLQRPGEKPAALVVAVLARRDGRWDVLHRRDSLEGNPVVSAALEDQPGAIMVHVFEARYQCDDESPIHYALAWDAASDAIRASVRSDDLHPFERNWDCGE